MRYFFLFACFITSPSLLIAQLDSFDIAGYARPDLRRETASIVPNFSINNQYRNSHDDEYTNVFRLNFGGNYGKTLFVNNVHEQIGSQINYGLRLNYTRNDGDNLNTNTFINFFNLRPSFNITKSHKKFRNETNKFFEYELIGGLNIDFLNFKQQNSRKVSRQLINGSFVSPIFFGKGRIELVNDYWHAATIFEMLNDQYLLLKSLEDELLLDFANQISSIKNTRNTDGRLELIAEYEMLCDYLISNNLVDPNNYKVFAHIRDAWVFEAFTNRFSGKEWKIGIAPQIRSQARNDGNLFIGISEDELFFFNNFNYNFSFGAFYYPYLLGYTTPYIRGNTFSGNFEAVNSHWLTLGTALSISYENRKSISMDWQKDFFINLQVGPHWSFLLPENTNGDSQRNTLQGNLAATYKIYYIPNARSFYEAGFNFLYQFDYYSLENSIGENFQERLITNISGRYTKYISPQLSWNLNAFLNFGKRQYFSDKTSASIGFNAGINYRFY